MCGICIGPASFFPLLVSRLYTIALKQRSHKKGRINGYCYVHTDTGTCAYVPLLTKARCFICQNTSCVAIAAITQHVGGLRESPATRAIPNRCCNDAWHNTDDSRITGRHAERSTVLLARKCDMSLPVPVPVPVFTATSQHSGPISEAPRSAEAQQGRHARTAADPSSPFPSQRRRYGAAAPDNDVPGTAAAAILRDPRPARSVLAGEPWPSERRPPRA